MPVKFPFLDKEVCFWGDNTHPKIWVLTREIPNLSSQRLVYWPQNFLPVQVNHLR